MQTADMLNVIRAEGVTEYNLHNKTTNDADFNHLDSLFQHFFCIFLFCLFVL